MSEVQRKIAMRNKRAGKKFEADLVKMARGLGFIAKRAWGSNGVAMGEAECVDIMIEEEKLQCKKKKNLPKWLGFDEEKLDGVVFKTDRGKPKILIYFDDYLALLSWYKRYLPKEYNEQIGGLTPLKEEKK